MVISSGCLFYGENRRRTAVDFDTTLRNLVAETSVALHAMIDSRQTPTAEYLARRCDACSLIDLCQPKAMRFKRGVQAWFDSNLKSQISNLKSEISNPSHQTACTGESDA